MKTLIVGGGLSGLALAERLQVERHDFLLLEARDRFGGRIMTEQGSGGGFFDMGPAWFWPGQPRIEAIVSRLGLREFDQYASGDLCFEDETGQVQRGRGFASMQGSWRLEGGLAALTKALTERISAEHRRLNAEVIRITQMETGCSVTLADGRTIGAVRVVLAMPPRLIAHLQFTPALPSAAIQAMQNVSTWMAGQAKAVAVYDTPFWRHMGLSGDAISRCGPLAEIHDASPVEGGPYALFGFIGITPDARRDEVALKGAVLDQLRRLFGEGAAAPRELFVKDWAADRFTATAADAAPVYHHPTYGLPTQLRDLWDGTLVFAGTEVAQAFGGYLEGALEAADAAFETLAAR